jgi:hypothetical protein
MMTSGAGWSREWGRSCVELALYLHCARHLVQAWPRKLVGLRGRGS